MFYLSSFLKALITMVIGSSVNPSSKSNNLFDGFLITCQDIPFLIKSQEKLKQLEDLPA